MEKEKKERFRPFELVIGLLMTLFVIGLVATLVIQFRPFYYWMVDLLHIPESSGYPRDEVILNFNSMMNFLIPFTGGTLKFATLPASEADIQHFVECKRIFNLFAAMIPVCGIPALLLARRERKAGRRHYRLTSGLMMIIIPVILGLGCAIDFDAAFVIFHKIFFRNDFWIFDYRTDPIILMLPENVFLIYEMIMVVIVLAVAIWMICSGKKHQCDSASAN